MAGQDGRRAAGRTAASPKSSPDKLPLYDNLFDGKKHSKYLRFRTLHPFSVNGALQFKLKSNSTICELKPPE
jgi:hypothetical protein